MVGQIAAQIGPYNLFWCLRYKKLVLFWRKRIRLACADSLCVCSGSAACAVVCVACVVGV